MLLLEVDDGRLCSRPTGSIILFMADVHAVLDYLFVRC